MCEIRHYFNNSPASTFSFGCRDFNYIGSKIDFLPLKPFRGRNWEGRWRRLQQSQKDLAILPPIDVVKYADRYWVADGHNRVGLALYNGQPEIDATIVEMVPPGGHRTEPIS